MNRRTATTLGMAWAALTACLVPTSAAPNLIGATGLLLNPTADLGGDRLDLQLTYLPARSAVETTDWFSLAGRYPLNERTELHGALEAMRATNDREGLAFGLKRQVQAETAVAPALAVGAYYDSILKDTAAYAVASLAGTNPMDGSPNGLRGHLGLRWDRYTGGRSESAATLFGGLEAAVGEDAHCFLEVGSQHHNRVHRKTPWAAGVRWRAGQNATLTAALATPAYGFAQDTVFSLTLGWRPNVP